ncbi:MAG: ATP-binding protein [Myxococcota bacterium]|jgi:hypothetical protein|nr:ATP-binding protein [Myxococcota bacterium]
MWIKRTISEKILGVSAHFPAVVLTGARQTGKTSLLGRLFPQHAYVALDIPSLAAMAEKEPSAFLDRYPAPVLIDEVQYAPGLFRHLKSAIDGARHEMGRYILTGSQKFPLMKEVAESLAGRCAILELETLSAREIAAADASVSGTNALAALIVRGGFPEMWRDQDIPTDVYFSSYLATYLERDVRQIVNVASLRDFERCVRACAARSGQILNKSELAREVGVSLTAITSWLNVLEASNQISFLEPWFSNLGKRLVKSPKLYFSDTGLLCYLLGITPQTLATSPFVGAIFETFVFSELRKAARLSPRPVSLWFYRDKQQLEVDFLVLGGGQGQLVECKWTEHPDDSDTKNLRRVARIVEDKKYPDFARTSSFVVARPHNEYLIDEQVRAVSVLGMPGALDLVP